MEPTDKGALRRVNEAIAALKSITSGIAGELERQGVDVQELQGNGTYTEPAIYNRHLTWTEQMLLSLAVATHQISESLNSAAQDLGSGAHKAVVSPRTTKKELLELVKQLQEAVRNRSAELEKERAEHAEVVQTLSSDRSKYVKLHSVVKEKYTQLQNKRRDNRDRALEEGLEAGRKSAEAQIKERFILVPKDAGREAALLVVRNKFPATAEEGQRAVPEGTRTSRRFRSVVRADA